MVISPCRHPYLGRCAEILNQFLWAVLELVLWNRLLLKLRLSWYLQCSGVIFHYHRPRTLTCIQTTRWHVWLDAMVKFSYLPIMFLIVNPLFLRWWWWSFTFSLRFLSFTRWKWRLGGYWYIWIDSKGIDMFFHGHVWSLGRSGWKGWFRVDGETFVRILLLTWGQSMYRAASRRIFFIANWW